MKKVIVLGAGFSGLTAAYFLLKSGYKVEIFEKEEQAGGLLRTVVTPWGTCETAANGILNSTTFEAMAKDLKLPLLGASKTSRNRYIYRNRLRRWPLSIFETLSLIAHLLFVWPKKPRSQESVSDWGKRVLGLAATRFLLEPALQGIYAGDSERMSASLILNRLFKKSKSKGLVSAPAGMGQVIDALEKYLKEHGVLFHFKAKDGPLKSDRGRTVVVATSAPCCAEILESISPRLSQALKSVEMVSLVRVTSFLKRASGVKGFGVLFPRNAGFRSLGILFNNYIFNRNEKFESESYIIGGALDDNVKELSETEALQVVNQDRKLLFKTEEEIIGSYIKKWLQVLPHYTLELETMLSHIKEERQKLETEGVFLIGNYWGGIGLSHLLEQSKDLPQKIERVKRGK